MSGDEEEEEEKEESWGAPLVNSESTHRERETERERRATRLRDAGYVLVAPASSGMGKLNPKPSTPNPKP